MIAGPRLPDADAGDIVTAIERRETPLGEFLRANVEEGFWASLPGQVGARVPGGPSAPTDDDFEAQARTSGLTVEQLRANARERGESALVAPSPAIDDPTWRASPHFREGVQWAPGMTERQAAARAEVFDANQYRRWLIRQREAGPAGTAAGFAAMMVGGLPDPLNFIPFAGPAFRAAAEARAGVVLGRAITESANVAIGQALEQPFVAVSRAQLGDDMTFASVLTDIAMGAALGFTLGGAVGAVARARGGRGPTPDAPPSPRAPPDDFDIVGPFSRERIPTMAEATAARAALSEGALDLTAGRPIDVNPAVPAMVRRAAETATPQFRDTRGGTERFHGSSSPVNSSDVHFGQRSIYGSGFYSTDAVDISIGYMRKGQGTDPRLYSVREIAPVQLLDLEQPIPQWLRDGLRDAERNMPRMSAVGEAIEVGLDGGRKIRHVYDRIRDHGEQAGVSDAEIVGIFDDIMRPPIEARGFAGISHIGGDRTGNAAHKVNIYFNPQRDVALTPAQPAHFMAAAERRIDTAVARETPTPEAVARIAEASRAVGAKLDTIEAKRADLGLDRGEEVDLAMFREMEAAGRIGKEDAALFANAEAAAAKAEATARGFDAAALCSVRG